MAEKRYVRVKPIPEEKTELVKELTDKMKKFKTILIASMKGLPSAQFNEIKKKLRGMSEVKVAKKSVVFRAIDSAKRGSLSKLKEEIGADFVLFFSDRDAFELSALLSDNESPARAKAGDISPEDIKVDAGMTDLLPGPAISELGSVGLKVKVTRGKLEIMHEAIIVKSEEKIKKNVASVLGKLGIEPMKVGFLPLAAYDSENDKVYVGIKIDKGETLEEMKDLIGKALGFAINVNYPTKETISHFIFKANSEEKVLEKLVGEGDKPEIKEGNSEKNVEEENKSVEEIKKENKRDGENKNE